MFSRSLSSFLSFADAYSFYWNNPGLACRHLPQLCHYGNTCFALQNSCLCVNPVFTMAYSTVHLHGHPGRWVCTKAKAVFLYLFVFLFFLFFGQQLITCNIIRSDGFYLRPTWVQIHVWGSQHRVTRLLFAVLAPGGIQAGLYFTGTVSTDLNDICFNKEPSSVFLVT